MIRSNVKEHMRGDLGGRGAGAFRTHGIFPVIGFIVCAGMATATWAQSGVSPLQVRVMDLTADTQRVIVPMNRSVVVETSVKVTRVDIVAEHIADVRPVSPTELIVTGKTYGHTNVILWDDADHQYLLDVSIELDLERLNEALAGVDPFANVEAKSILGNIVLTGTVSNIERAERMGELATLFLPTTGGKRGSSVGVQNHLQVSGEQQVLLRCTVAEVSRTAMRELGINGFLMGENFKDAFLVNNLGGINPSNIGATAGALVTENVPFLTGSEGIPIGPSPTISLGFPRAQMQAFIRALADNSLASVLAEPNLVAISGETASFLAGGEFPYPVGSGNQQTSIEFREFGVRLSFTPVALGHQRIRLHVAPEVSELDWANAVQIEGFAVPGLASRATQTTVEVGSGQTIAIAGLLREDIAGMASRVPGVGDLPVIGALFRSVNFQRSMTELVILVTPELVAPLEPHQAFPLPNDDFVWPNDYELYMLGLLEGAEQADAADPSDSWAAGPGSTRTVLASDPNELSIHGPWGHAGMAEAQRR